MHCFTVSLASITPKVGFQAFSKLYLFQKALKMKLSCLYLLAISILSSARGQVIDLQKEVGTEGKVITLEACRRDPTWRGDAVDHDECRRLTGWKPRDFWWRMDKNHTKEVLEGKEQEIAECIDKYFEEAKQKNDKDFWWAA